MADPLKPTGREALNDQLATELNHSDGDRLVETRRPLDELDVELKDLGGDCIKVMQLLKSDSSLLKDRALAVLHLGVSRGCIEIVEQVVKFVEGGDSLGDRSERGLEKDEQQTTRATEDGTKALNGDRGEDILGDSSETDQQGVQSSREEEITASNDNTDAPTVALDELQTQRDDKNENSDSDPSHSQDDSIRMTAVGKGTSRHSSDFLDFVDVLVKEFGENHKIEEQPVLDFGKLLHAKYLYSGPARELDALKVAVVNGNLDVLALLLTKTPSASRIGPKTRSVALHELHRNRLREIMERVVESIRGHSVSLKIYQSVFDAWRDDPEFNFLFWDFGLGQERVPEYLFHFLFTKRVKDSSAWRYALRLRVYLWGKVWDYKGEPWEEPLWKSLLKLHDAQGRTPLHVAVDENIWAFGFLLEELRLADAVEVAAFAMEATDGLEHQHRWLANAPGPAKASIWQTQPFFAFAPVAIRIIGDAVDFANVKHIPPNYEWPPAYESTTVGRQGCINLLLQSGCDIFKVDKNGQAPYPKGTLSQDEKFLSWWYDRQLKEFTANQSAMSFATNAISVMATLVATAS